MANENKKNVSALGDEAMGNVSGGLTLEQAKNKKTGKCKAISCSASVKLPSNGWKPINSVDIPQDY